VKFPKRTAHSDVTEDKIILDILITLGKKNLIVKLWLIQLRVFLGLENVLKRCNTSLDHVPSFIWSSELSPGEVARLCFARVFFHKPVLTVLDEATAPLPLDVEEMLYE